VIIITAAAATINVEVAAAVPLFLDCNFKHHLRIVLAVA
jgi:hypothetical protein